jgi:hypothetical protein
MPANYIFLPWVQPGTAVHIPDTATDRLAADQSSVVSLTVKLDINADKVIKLAVNPDSVSREVRFYGPGDITGINPQQVVRTEPRHRTPDFEPNYFAAVEFDRPDFPWLFTPAKGDAQGRLRPWLCLVVVRKQQGVTLRPAVTTPLPVLATPIDELPDLAESWAWAHAQVTGSELDELKDKLANAPSRSVSRLLCPRRLDPLTEYIACVVPTFEVGRKSGLNLKITPVEETRLESAWPRRESRDPKRVELPVYYHWEFRTGAGEDFEELVRRLEAREMPPEVGKRPMDISRPGFEFQPTADVPAVLGLEGALRVVKTGPDNWLDGSRLPFQAELKRLINTPWQIATKDGNQEPVVGPPLYGCWLTTVHEVAKTDPPAAPPAVWPPPFWLDELNLDPRNRATAGAGTEVVRKEQESLMASAWEQLGDIEKINQRKRQAQLGRAVNNVYHAKTFSNFSEETFLKIVAPAHSRIVLEDKTRLSQKIAASVVPPNTVSAPLRRLTRPRGAINRKFARAGKPGVGAMFMLFNRAAEERPPTRLLETIWIDNATPEGANLEGTSHDEGWHWVSERPTPYTGTKCHQAPFSGGQHEHSFHSMPKPFNIGVGDRLFAYILMSFSSPHREIMLKWHTKEHGWEHRAYWGEDLILEGVNGTVSRRRMGDVTRNEREDVWLRLEVPAKEVGLEGLLVDGMCFTLFRGFGAWDRAGHYGPHHKGLITINRVSNLLPAGLESFLKPGPPPKWERVTDGVVQAHDSFRLRNLVDKIRNQPVPAEQRDFLKAARAHQDYLVRVFGDPNLPISDPAKRPEIVPLGIKGDALISLNPQRTIAARVLPTLAINSRPLRTGDPLDPVMDAPTFPQPMYESLRDLSAAFLFPGLDQVPPDSVQLLETNAQFIESFMVGLNVEMSRELLWRGYPTDQRGTYFQHFWDAIDDDPQLAPDVPPIHLWGRSKLGDNATGAAAGNKLVLLIRGELLRRYPNTVIYAVKAVSGGTQPDLPPDPLPEIHPIFRGTLEPDVTFLGFDLTADEVRKDAGYFFVLQQQPTEPRFGLDAAPFSRQPGKPDKLPALQSWDDLNWGHLAGNPTELNALAHVSVNDKNVQPKPTDNHQGKWGHNSAHMAYITKQRLVRIAIHASQMLPAAEVSDPRK